VIEFGIPVPFADRLRPEVEQHWDEQMGVMPLGHRAVTVVNLILNSSSIDEAETEWTDGNASITPTTGQDDPWGGTTASLLDVPSAQAFSNYYTDPTFTGDGEKSVSISVKEGTSTATRFRLRDETAAADRRVVEVTWSGGVPSVASIAGSGSIYDVEDEGDGWHRVGFTAESVVAANTNRFYIYPTGYGTDTGNVYVAGPQTENADHVNHYVATSGTSATGYFSDVRFLAPRGVEFVEVHVQHDGAGGGGYNYNNTTYVSRTLADCRADRLQEVTVTKDGTNNYYVWLIPVLVEA
jgi:hypothetical protein